MCSALEHWICHIEQNEWNSEELSSIASELSFSVIHFLYHRNQMVHVKEVLRWIEKDWSSIHLFFIQRPNLEQVLPELIAYGRFLEFHIPIKSIHESNIPILLSYQNQYKHPFQKEDYVYLCLLSNQPFNMTLSPHMPIQSILSYFLTHQKISCIQKWTSMFTHYNLFQLLLDHIELPFSSLEWLMMEVLEETDIHLKLEQLLTSVICYDRLDLFRWLDEHFKERLSIPEVVRDLFNYSRVSFLDYLWTTRREDVRSVLLFLYPHFSIHSLEMFIWIHENLSLLPFQSYRLWNIFGELYDHSHYEWLLFLEEHGYISDESPFLYSDSPIHPDDWDIKDPRVYQWFESKEPQLFMEDVEVLLKNAIEKRYNQVVEWFLVHYRSQLMITRRLLHSITRTNQVSMIQLMSVYFPWSYLHDDYVMRIACNFGYPTIASYLHEKHPSRYQTQCIFIRYDHLQCQYKRRYKLKISFPKKIIDTHREDNSTECCICYDSYSTMIETSCKHHYCINCLKQWLYSSTEIQCAYCRQLIQDIYKCDIGESVNTNTESISV